MKKIVIIGAGGNSKVIVDTIKKRNVLQKEPLKIMGVLDDAEEKKELCGFPVLGPVNEIEKLKWEPDVFFVNGIGNNAVRKRIYEAYSDAKWYTLIHPTAIIAEDVVIGEGTIVMPGAIINTESRIGRFALINTGSIIEHENEIGDFVHLASGVTTAGEVKIGEGTMLGTGAKVIQGIKIGKHTIIGAGACVIKNIPDDVIAVGVPAKVIKRTNGKGEKFRG